MTASERDDLAVAVGEIARQLRDAAEPEARALADYLDGLAVRLFDAANDAWRAEHFETSAPNFPRGDRAEPDGEQMPEGRESDLAAF